MIVQFGEATLELVCGDIAQQCVDAIVNAANSRLMGGGGVDGAIHRAGGAAIMAETRRRYPQGCPAGDAVPSGAGNLPAKYVIHAVGPVYRGGGAGEAELLASAYRKALRVAAELECATVALPALSTGAYGYPLADAAQVALATVIEHMRGNALPGLVRVMLFGDEALRAFEEALSKLQAPPARE
jgi:O-acetyl-ADP-ribose deacetylase (regulator of RNase III)